MFTNQGLQKILNYWGGANIVQANNLYLALFTAAPTESGNTWSFTEPSATTYQRVQINGTTTGSTNTKFGSAQVGTDDVYITNNTAIYFPETYNTSNDTYEDWGTITHIGILSNSSIGNGTLYAYAALDSSIHPGGTSQQSNIVVVRTGDLRVGIKSGTTSASMQS